MKQEPEGYNITSNTLEFVRITLKIMWRFLQENVDDFHRKILTFFLWKVDYVLRQNLTISGRKFNAFAKKNTTICVGSVDNLCRKILQFLYKNLTIFARKFYIFLQENLSSFAGKSVKFCRKIWKFLQKNVDNFCAESW